MKAKLLRIILHSNTNFYSSFKDYALPQTQLQLTSMGINMLLPTLHTHECIWATLQL